MKPQAALLWGRGPPGNLAPSLLPAGTPSSTSISYQQGGGKGIHCKETVAERGTNRDFEMLKRWGGSIRLPSPKQGFSLLPRTCSHCPSCLTTPAMGTSPLQLPIPFPPPWQFAPKLPMAHSYPTSFWKPQTEGWARPKLKPVQMWNKR